MKIRSIDFILSLLLAAALAVPLISIASNADDLINAVWAFDTKKAAELIERGVDINGKNAQGTTALLLACSYKDNDEMIEFLVSKGADVNLQGGDGKRPLALAAKYSKKAVELLLDKGADVNATGEMSTTALMWAGHSGQVEIVELLIEKGADVNMKDSTGQTALHWASEQSQDEVQKVLKANGAKE